MSRAFVKEDVEAPERSGRRRSASGLPAGAKNYITAQGASLLRDRAAQLRGAGQVEAADDIDNILAAVSVVEPANPPPEGVAFGATVVLESANGSRETYRIVGVDEVDLHEHAVSWVSPLGRALLGKELGDAVNLEGTRASIIRIAYGASTS